MTLKTVEWKDNSVIMIDQTKLPNILEYVTYTDYNQVADAIRTLVIRGAPAIGVSGAFGLALASLQSSATEREELILYMENAKKILFETRPTAELESAVVLHKNVAEAAIVGFPHEIKGQGIYAYVTLNTGVEPTDDLKKELVQQVRKEIGPIATFDVIQWAPGLPKTRSGKIMRRILRKIAENDMGSIGDTSTLADPSVVEDLIANRSA